MQPLERAQHAYSSFADPETAARFTRNSEEVASGAARRPAPWWLARRSLTVPALVSFACAIAAAKVPASSRQIMDWSAGAFTTFPQQSSFVRRSPCSFLRKMSRLLAQQHHCASTAATLATLSLSVITSPSSPQRPTPSSSVVTMCCVVTRAT